LASVSFGLSSAGWVCEWLKSREYDQNRRETAGRVIRKETKQVKTGRGGQKTLYIVSFRFAEETGEEHVGNATVSPERYGGLAFASDVPVIYQAEDLAGLKWIDSDADHRQSLGRAWKAALLPLIIVLVVGLGIDCYLRLERSLARNGIATRGTVKSITEHTVKGGGKTWSVAYEFHTEKSENRNGYSFIRNREQAYAVPVGGTIIVLYDPERPWRHRLLKSLRYVDPKSLLT